MNRLDYPPARYCAAGLNRSALCAALWLIKHGALHGGGVLTAREAIDLIQAHRTGALFNPHFVAALTSWYGGAKCPPA